MSIFIYRGVMARKLVLLDQIQLNWVRSSLASFWLFATSKRHLLNHYLYSRSEVIVKQSLVLFAVGHIFIVLCIYTDALSKQCETSRFKIGLSAIPLTNYQAPSAIPPLGTSQAPTNTHKEIYYLGKVSWVIKFVLSTEE